MFKYIIAEKSMWNTYDRDSNYLHNDGYVGKTPSKHFSGDCYYDAFYKARWFDTYEDAIKTRNAVIPTKKNVFDNYFNAIDFNVVPVKITWCENDFGKKYPKLEVIKSIHIANKNIEDNGWVDGKESTPSCI